MKVMKQHLRSHEIELPMGHEKYVTKHPSVTNKDINQCLGNGSDMNVVEQILKHLDLGEAQKVRRTRKRPFRKAYMARDMGRKQMQDFEFGHGSLGHPSPTAMEIIQKMEMIEGKPKLHEVTCQDALTAIKAGSLCRTRQERNLRNTNPSFKCNTSMQMQEQSLTLMHAEA